MGVLPLYCAALLLGACSATTGATASKSLYEARPFPIEEANRVAADPKSTQADVAVLWEEAKASYKSCAANLDDLKSIHNPQ